MPPKGRTCIFGIFALKLQYIEASSAAVTLKAIVVAS